MTTPRTKKMLLLAAATMATPVVASSCSTNEPRVSGFYGDVAYDSGYDDTGTFGNTDASRTPATPEAGQDKDADTSDADADIGDAAADADADQ